jgi:hypothetical protein
METKMNLADITTHRRNVFIVNKELKEFLETQNFAGAVSYYALLSPEDKAVVQKQDYWARLDKAIDSMAYGQI